MDIAWRLKQERERLGLTQTEFGRLGEAGKTTVIGWERGSAFPNAAFLQAIARVGADVRYIVTGEREGPPPVKMTAEEEVLLNGFRAMDAKTKRRIMAFVYGGELGEGPAQIIHGSVGTANSNTKGDLHFHAPIIVGGTPEKSK